MATLGLVILRRNSGRREEAAQTSMANPRWRKVNELYLGPGIIWKLDENLGVRNGKRTEGGLGYLNQTVAGGPTCPALGFQGWAM